ncbi:MAG: HpcH/HpaI aldolase/citrate lyase family protein [Caldimonas sp.]
MDATARTYLFVPGDRPERFAKALASGADAVVLDLEDAVAGDAKARARDAVAERLLAATAEERAHLVVRINDESSTDFQADLAMLQAARAACVMLPKAERAASVARVRAVCPGIAVLALIETARGVLQAEALAEAPGVQRLVFGTIDFALDLDLSGDPVGFDHAAARIALASRAAGLAAPVAGVTPEIADPVPLLADLQRARAHGFGAKLCIHPKQVALVHDALRPSPAEIEWAERVIAAGASGAAVQVDGRMVDRPVLQRARALLDRAAR